MNRVSRQMRLILGAVVLAATVMCFGCSDEYSCEGRVCRPSSNAGKVTVTQGIWGDVWFWRGDFQPVCPSGTVTAVAREMRIHQLTAWDQADEVGYTAFFSSIHTELVATVHSNAAGFFQVELPPGTYSLFAVEETLFYADRFDGSGNINPVVVKDGQVTDAHFDIDYMAAW